MTNVTLWADMAKRLRCHICHSGFPNLHLLDIHISEVHDAFFDAQVKRGLPVYQCLVEYCGQTFRTVDERRNHLIHDHAFSPEMHLEEMHLLTHKARQKVSSSSDGMDLDACEHGLSRLRIHTAPSETSRRRIGPVPLRHRARTAGRHDAHDPHTSGSVGDGHG